MLYSDDHPCKTVLHCFLSPSGQLVHQESFEIIIPIESKLVPDTIIIIIIFGFFPLFSYKTNRSTTHNRLSRRTATTEVIL